MMVANAGLQDLVEHLDRLAAEGHESVSIPQLSKSLRYIIANGEADHAIALTNHSHQLEFERDANLEMFRSVITTGQAALKSTMLLNGGAAVAMLAFMGKLVESNSIDASSVANAIFIFALGALLATTASGCTYMSQFAYGVEEDKGRWMRYCARAIHVLTIGLVVGSLGLFGYGAWTVSRAVSGFSLSGNIALSCWI